MERSDAIGQAATVMRVAALVTVMSLYLRAGSAEALLVEIDWVPGSGDGAITFDSVTEFEWLDVTETVNLTYNQVVAQLSPGGTYEGFQVASTAQVQTMFVNGGWTGSWNTNYSGDPVRLAQATALVDLLGVTTANYPPYATYGFVSDAVVGGNHYYDFIYAYAPSVHGAAFTNQFSASPDSTADYIGTFLYREASAVPIPGTTWLLAAGFGALGLGVRRKPAYRRPHRGGKVARQIASTCR